MSKCAQLKVWVALTDAEEQQLHQHFGYDPGSVVGPSEELEDALADALSERVDEVLAGLKANPNVVDHEYEATTYI